MPGPPSSRSRRSERSDSLRFPPLRQLSGSEPPLVGPASQGHICLLQELCRPSCHSPSSHPLSRTMGWDTRVTPAIRLPRSTSEVERQFSTLAGQRSPTARGLSSLQTSTSQLFSVRGPHGVHRRQSPPRFPSPLLPPGPLPAPPSPSSSQVLNPKEQLTRLSCGQSAKPRPRRGQQGSTQTSSRSPSPEEKVFPAHSVKDYNNAVVNCAPGSVHGMKVFF